MGDVIVCRHSAPSHTGDRRDNISQINEIIIFCTVVSGLEPNKTIASGGYEYDPPPPPSSCSTETRSGNENNIMIKPGPGNRIESRQAAVVEEDGGTSFKLH